MTVVGMGFSLEDAQEAVQAGKLQPDAIIDWIVSKPTQARPSGSATLRLGRPQVPHLLFSLSYLIFIYLVLKFLCISFHS